MRIAHALFTSPHILNERPARAFSQKNPRRLSHRQFARNMKVWSKENTTLLGSERKLP